MADPSARRTICLLTDFGLEDNYVGVLKGVIRSIAPEAEMIDLTHGVPPQDVFAGAFLLEKSVDYCPPDSVFLAVVDPGVGSERRKIAVQSGKRVFVGPDNGLFTAFLDQALVHAIENPRHRLPKVSKTFHGRDVFAPAAAHLAVGVPVTDFGPTVEAPVRIERPAPHPQGDSWVGEIVYVDRYGNLVTNFDEERFASPLEHGAYRVETSSGIHWPYVSAYAQAPEGDFCSVFGGFGLLELSVNCGSAAGILRLDRGARVVLRPC